MNAEIVTIYWSLIMSKLTTQFHTLVLRSCILFCCSWQSIIIWLLIYNVQKSQNQIIADNPLGILHTGFHNRKEYDTAWERKCRKTERTKNFQAQLPGSFAQDVFPLTDYELPRHMQVIMFSGKPSSEFPKEFLYPTVLCKPAFSNFSITQYKQSSKRYIQGTCRLYTDHYKSPVAMFCS